MTRVNKIEFLNKMGENIKYHFGYYTFQRRLIIDEVNGLAYNKSDKNQKVAREHVDLLYWERTRE